jgi:hypothetical protein
MKKSQNKTIVTALLSSAVTAAVILTAYGLPVSESADAKPAYNLDVNNDGKVNIMDLNVLKTELFNTEKTVPATDPSMPIKDDGWKQAYQNTITEYTKNSEFSSEVMWNIIDLDADGVPELLISEGGFRAAGVRFYGYSNGKAEVVTDEKGEAIVTGSFGEVFVTMENDLVSSIYMGQGYQFYSVYKYENHKLTELVSLGDDAGLGNEKVNYMVNGKEASEAEYNKAEELLSSHRWQDAARKYAADNFSALK